MQQIYRRRTSSASGYIKKKNGGVKDESYKRHIAKQGICCILMFLSLMSVKTSEEKNMVFATNSVRYIVNNQTDIKEMYNDAKSFIYEKILNEQKTEETLSPLAELSLPVSGNIIKQFGNGSSMDEFHYGVDFAGELGDKICCVADGQAEEVGYSEKYGNYILIKHSDKISSFYSNCEKILPEEGDKIKSGQIIATIGNINNESYLHFEIREGDMSLDPTVFLDIK